MFFRKNLAILSITVFSVGVVYPAISIKAAVPQDITVGDVHLTSKSLAFRYKDMFMAANIPGYNYIGGIMLPLRFSADIIGSYVEVDHQRGIAKGWIERPDNTFLLDMAKRKLQIGEQERILPQGVVTMVGTEMYVDASFLATILPVNYLLHYDTNIVEIQPQKDLRVFQRMDFISRYFENIRKQAGLPYRPWTLEEVIAATSPSDPAVRQPGVPASGENISPQRPATIPGFTPQIEIPMEEPISDSQQAAPFATPGVTPRAPLGAVAIQNVPQLPVAGATGTVVGMNEDEVGPDANENASGSEGSSSRVIRDDNILLDTTLDKELQAVNAPELNDDNLIILQPQLGEIRGDYIEAYQHENGTYLPLGHLMDILELGIGVNPATLEASGFFITEDNTFYLNGKTNEAIIAGKKITFPAGLIIANPFEVYVDAQLLSQLLPLDFQLNMSQLALIINPREKLPLQAKLERGEKWSRIAEWQKYDTNPYADAVEVKTPYKAASVPFADIRVGTEYNSVTGVRNNASVVAAGDLGYVNTETFASVDLRENDTVNAIRFKAGRSDRDGELLGPLKAKEAYVGDVQSYPLPLVSTSQLGRGAKISNRDLLRPDQFDETDFYGDAQPGWEVELYQNNVLIDFQVVGEDGRYAFTGVPINYGDNTFRIVQYGPQGQKQEEVREFNIDDRMPKPGELNYAVSANQQGVGLIDLQEKTTGTNRPDGTAVVGVAEYGLTEKISIGAGFGHVPVTDINNNVAEYDFASASLRTSLFGVRTNFDTAYDVSNCGWAFGVTGLARYGTTNIRGEQRVYSNFDSAEQVRSFLRPVTAEEVLNGVTDTRIESQLQTLTDFNVNRPVSLSTLGNISLGGNFHLETYEDGESDLSLGGRISKNYIGNNFSTALRYRNLDRGTLGDEQFIDGTMSLRRRFDNDLTLRAATSYQFVPDFEFKAANISLQKTWSEDINTRLEYSQSLLDTDNGRLTGYLNWDFDKFYLSPRFTVDRDLEYLLGVELQFSLGMDSRTRNWHMTSERLANSGALSARAFMDENADGVKDENEELVEGVIFNDEFETNEDGTVFIPRLTAHQPRYITVDKDSVRAIGAKPKESAYAVIGRPGMTTELDYAIVPTLEIEGNAYLVQEGEQLEYPGLSLELVNEEGEVVRQVRTEFDGYYYMPDVYPGKYTLRVAEKDQKMQGLIAEPYEIDTIALRQEGKYEGYVTGYDFVVSRDEPTQMNPEQSIMVAEQSDADTNLPQVPTETDIAPEMQIETVETEIAVQPQVPAASPSPIAAITPPETTTASKPEAPIIPPATVKEAPVKTEEARKVFVQAGMYCDYTNAQRQVDTLKIAGFKASLKGRSYKGQSCYLVQVGPARDLAAAEQITDELENMGLETPIIVEENAQVFE